MNTHSPDEIMLAQCMTGLTFHVLRPVGRGLALGHGIIVTLMDHEGNVSPWLGRAPAEPARSLQRLKRLGQVYDRPRASCGNTACCQLGRLKAAPASSLWWRCQYSAHGRLAAPCWSCTPFRARADSAGPPPDRPANGNSSLDLGVTLLPGGLNRRLRVGASRAESVGVPRRLPRAAGGYG